MIREIRTRWDENLHQMCGSYYHPLFQANFNHPTAIWSEDMNK
jgi:hypothetical protein